MITNQYNTLTPFYVNGHTHYVLGWMKITEALVRAIAHGVGDEVAGVWLRGKWTIDLPSRLSQDQAFRDGHVWDRVTTPVQACTEMFFTTTVTDDMAYFFDENRWAGDDHYRSDMGRCK